MNETRSERTKNGALVGQNPVLVNPTFTADGAGWTGDGFVLGGGCKAGSLKKFPSLGQFQPNALTFGTSFNMVTQDVTVPKPTTLTFSFRLQFLKDEFLANFGVTLQPQFSAATSNDNLRAQDYLAPKRVSLAVTTTRDNERVQIMLYGGGGPVTSGCAGPVVTNASLDVPVAATTTTTTTTTTTSTTVVKTTTTVGVTPSGPTTTLGAPTTSCTKAKCDIGSKGPNGGVVFITPSTPGNSTGNYFEALYSTFVSNVLFGCPSNSLPTTGSAIGDGPSNTARLVFRCGSSTVISKARSALNGAVSDTNAWFLPSIGELEQLVKNAGRLGKVGEYWSSTTSGSKAMKASSLFQRPFYAFDRELTQPFDAALIAQFRSDLSTVPVTDKVQNYSIGDLGPAGGRVFITPSTKGNTTGKYFEVAPTNWSGTEITLGVNTPQVAWSCNAYHLKSLLGTRTEIGSGAFNTAKINGACATATQSADWAADKAAKYRGGNRSDWFAPSKDELLMIYLNIDAVAPALVNRVARPAYQIVCAWSSSEMSATVAWGGNGYEAGGDELHASKKQISTNCVLPVRMFDANETVGPKG